MNVNDNAILQPNDSGKKRKTQQVSYTKKLRSKIPRRKRFQISPIINGSSNSLISDKKTELSTVTATSSCSSCFPGEFSCDSNWICVDSDILKQKQRSPRRKQRIEKTRGSEVGIRAGASSYRQLKNFPDEDYRRITRSYSRKIENERTMMKKENGDRGVNLSESSCVESSSGAGARGVCKVEELTGRKSKLLRTSSYQGASRSTENEEKLVSQAIAISGNSCIQLPSKEKAPNFSKISEFSRNTSKQGTVNRYEAGTSLELEIHGSEAISEASRLASLSEAKNQTLSPSVPVLSDQTAKDDKTRASGFEISEISRNHVELTLAVSNSESTAEKKPKDFDLDSDLACSGHTAFEDDSGCSSTQEMTLSQFQPEILPGRSDISDYSPLLCLESLSDFSERSEDRSTPSACFSLFLQFRHQFSESSSRPDSGVSSRIHDDCSDEFIFLRFEEEEHEKSYKMMRSRERSEVFLHNYAEDYFLTTELGEVVVEKRLLMVNWIVEQSDSKELQYETMFLGVSLLDRFLSQGCFKSERNLQLVGIACLTLATRIEENQPNNCVQETVFHVGSDVYTRSEVVAMEWLVLEVLNFQCCFPTIHNFLWFYLKAARADAEVENRANYLAVLSLLDHERLCYWPSTTAAGLVILASLASNKDSSCQRVMETHVRTKNDDLPECIQSLEWLVKYVC